MKDVVGNCKGSTGKDGADEPGTPGTTQSNSGGLRSVRVLQDAHLHHSSVSGHNRRKRQNAAA